MAYAYCLTCDAELDNPTFAECIRGQIECHVCDDPFQLNESEREDAIIEMEERLSKVEEFIQKLTQE